MSYPVLGAVVFLTIYGLAAYVVLRLETRALTRQARSLADDLAAAGAQIDAIRPPQGPWSPAVAEITHEGRPVSVQVRPFRRDWIVISIAVPSRPLPHVLLRTQRANDQLGKHLGLDREVQMGDLRFDDAAYIATVERDDVVHRLLEPPGVREAVLALLATGYRVDMSPEGLKATRVQRRLAPIDPTVIPGVVRALYALVPLLPEIDPSVLRKPPWLRGRSSLYAAALVALLGPATPLVARPFLHPLVARGDVLQAFLVGFALWLAAVIALFLVLRGGTRPLGQLVVTAFLLLLGLPATGALAAALANAGLDRSAPAAHRTRVLAVRAKSAEATFASWRPDAPQIAFSVPMAEFAQLRAGDVVDVITHPGALGWEWVEEIR